MSISVNRRLCRALYSTTALVALAGAAVAEDITYIGPVNGGGPGSWTFPHVWSSNSVPTAADTVIVAPGTNSIGVPSSSTVGIGKIYFAPGSKLNTNGIGQVGPSGAVEIYGIDGIGIHYATAQSSTGPRNTKIMTDMEYLIDNPDGGTLMTGPGNGANVGVELHGNTLTINAVNSNNTFDAQANIKGAGNLILKGNGVLISGGVNTYTGYTDIRSGTFRLTGNGVLSSSRSINIDGTFDVSGVTPAATSIQALTGSATGSVVLGGKTLDLANASGLFAGVISGNGGLTVASGTQVLAGDNTYRGLTTIAGGAILRLGAGGASGSLAGDVLADGSLVFDRSDLLDVAGAIAGAGTVEQAGSGTTVLSGANTYTGETAISGGTLRAGGANTLSAASDYVVSARGMLDLDGFGHAIASLENAGGVRLSGAGNTRLTVARDYVGNGGILYVSAALGGDGSASDLLEIGGDTSGSTNVVVTNIGGAGAPTLEGIRIIDVAGVSNGTFSLLGDYVIEGRQAVVAGAYGYTLWKNGVSDPADGDWYLRSQLKPVDPVDPIGPVGPIYQPGVPIYEAYAQVLLGMNGLSTLRQRVGGRYQVGTAGMDSGETASAAGSALDQNGLWALIEGTHAKFRPDTSTSEADYDLNSWKMRAGVDGQISEWESGKLIAGVMAHHGQGSANISSFFGPGSVLTADYGIGATATWYGNNGFYLDGQAQAAWFNSDLSSGWVGNLISDNHGFGYALSVEGGQRVGIADDWAVIPQAQLVYSNARFDSFVDPFGAEVSGGAAESLRARFGLALEHGSTWTNERGQLERAAIYGVANLNYELLDGVSADVSGTGVGSRNAPLWGDVGLGGSYNWNDDMSSLHGEISASSSLDNVGNSYTLAAKAGFRIKW